MQDDPLEHELVFRGAGSELLGLSIYPGPIRLDTSETNHFHLAIDACSWVPIAFQAVAEMPFAIRLHKVDCAVLIQALEANGIRSKPIRIEGANKRVLALTPTEPCFGPRTTGIGVEISDLDNAASPRNRRLLLPAAEVIRLASALRWAMDSDPNDSSSSATRGAAIEI